ncbi:MAG: DUF4112 domain-containing protein [Gammaproteobacteria bacterium]
MTAADQANKLRRAQQLAYLFDAACRIPGTRWRIGLDGLIGLLPGIGDVITAGTSIYIIYLGRKPGMPLRLQLHMFANVLLDVLVGSIPLLGDVFDIHFKANLRNVALMTAHHERAASRVRQA